MLGRPDRRGTSRESLVEPPDLPRPNSKYPSTGYCVHVDMDVHPAGPHNSIPRLGGASPERDLPNTVGQYQQAGQLYAEADGDSVRNVAPQRGAA